MGACMLLGLIWPNQWLGRWHLVPALFITICGAIFGISGYLALGRNRTIYPEPRPASVLIRHGIYGRVRHPLYTSVMLLAVAWGLWCRSVPAVLASGVLILFMVLKTRNEEVRLLRRFPSYSAYRATTWRFFPWVF